jgi:hypothetical protein
VLSRSSTGFQVTLSTLPPSTKIFLETNICMSVFSYGLHEFVLTLYVVHRVEVIMIIQVEAANINFSDTFL